MNTAFVLVSISVTAISAVLPGAAFAADDFVSHHFETSDGVELHYLEAGSGPLLVFVPGWTMPAEIWEHQIRHFAPKYRVVALDPRGHGRSEKPTYGYHYPRLAQDIFELLEHLGGGPAVVAGWSAAMTQVLLMNHDFGSENVRALLLVDHSIHYENPERFAPRFISMQTEREEWTRNFIKAIHKSPQSDEYFERMTEAALSVPTNAAAIMLANTILMGPTDLRPMLDALEIPALFITSSLGWAVAQAELVREGWPKIQVRVIDETSHALFVDKPVEFNLAVEEFLATLPQ